MNNAITNNATYKTDASVHIINGRVGSGKTQRIIECICELAKDSAEYVPNKSILICVATFPAAQALSSRLHASLVYAGYENFFSNIKIITPNVLALEILSSPEAIAQTGRYGRVLHKFEEDILFEDLKTSGIEPHRLKKMLEFLTRSAADLEPFTDDWFYNEQEVRVYKLLQDNLNMRKAYRIADLARSAWDLLNTSEDARLAHSYKHVFADDFQMYSKATQHILGLLAQRNLTVTNDSLAQIKAEEPYPFINGINTLAVLGSKATTEELSTWHSSKEINCAVCCLTKDLLELKEEELALKSEIIRPNNSEIATSIVRSFNTPNDELSALAEELSSTFNQNNHLNDIAIITPNKNWTSQVVRYLEKRGISTSTLERIDVNIKLNDSENNIGRVITLLRLAANNADPLALRDLCAFGDYLANSVIGTATANGSATISLEQGLVVRTNAKSALLLLKVDEVNKTLAEASEILKDATHYTGSQLFSFICKTCNVNPESISRSIHNIVSKLDSEATAQDICNALEKAVLKPEFIGAGARIGSQEDFIGQPFRRVYLLSLVNGLTPKRNYFDPTQVERDKRPKILNEEISKVYYSAGKAKDELKLSYFTSAPLIFVESHKIKINRIKLQDGERICDISPSETIRSITGVRFCD